MTVELTRRFIKPKVRAHAWEPGPRCGTRWQFAPGDQRLRHWRLRRYGGEIEGVYRQFRRENYEWPRCLERSTVATMNAEPVHGSGWQGIERATSGIASSTSRPPPANANAACRIAVVQPDDRAFRECGRCLDTSRKRAAVVAVSSPARALGRPGARRVYVCHSRASLSPRGHRLYEAFTPGSLFLFRWLRPRLAGVSAG